MFRVPVKGTAALLIALAVVIVALIGVPASRLFLAIAVPLGVLVALILRFWYQRRPVKVEDKRPLKLD